MGGEIEFVSVTTRGGDKGESRLADGWAGPKSHPRFQLLGELDELSSYLGVVRRDIRELDIPARFDPDYELREAQKRLGTLMGMAAVTPRAREAQEHCSFPSICAGDIEELEQREAWLLTRVTMPNGFIIPGDAPESASLDYARTICRRVERTLVAAIRSRERPRPDLHDSQRYVNRLSDYLFVLARYIEQHGEA